MSRIRDIFLKYVYPDAFKEIDVQYPMATDGDSIYVKDINISNSDNGGFSGVICDYFDSLKTVNNDASATNPKTIMVWFNRSIQANSIGFGCDDLTKSFSNIVVKVLGSGEVVRYTNNDFIADSTKRNSQTIDLPQLKLNGFIIEFHTADEIGLSNIILWKATDVNARIQAQKDDETIVPLTATDSGNLRVSDAESGLAIAKGDVVDTSFIHKFGNAPLFNIASGFADIWDGSDSAGIAEYNYTYSTSNAIDSISSSDNGDTQDIKITGLYDDGSGNWIEHIQTITATGQTRKALDQSLIRVFRMENVGSIDMAGTLYCYENTALAVGVPIDTTKIRALIDNGNNQTLMALYTIPSNKTGYMRDWYASASGAKKTSVHVIHLDAREIGSVFQLKHVTSIIAVGTSYIQHKYEEPEVFLEKTDIIMHANTDENDASISAGFDIVLVDN